MVESALHAELPDLAPEVLSRDPALLSGVTAHVAAGCSPCARALYNAREAALAVAEPTPATLPGASLRGRLLDSARAALSSRAGSTPRRFFDPAGELARLHTGTPEDEARTREVDELGLATAGADACEILLAEVQALLGFPLLFVSVIRGDRCGYRAQIGLPAVTMGTSPPNPGGARDRRRATTFCTHAVSGDAPMIVPDAAREPFFRGSPMVLREGVRAYVGVPLRTSRGIVVGTVCAMDFAPRRIDPVVVRVLDLYTRPIAAEIERARPVPMGGGWPRTARGAILHPEGWFRDLSAIPREPLSPLPPLPLASASGPGAEALADLALPGEIAGRLAGDAVGLLLPLRHPPPGDRLIALRAALGPRLSSS